jgi:hypothetical protein
MLGSSWVPLIRRIPPHLHDCVSFATVNGSEIMAQNILAMEVEFLLLRGRMGGSQDSGRVIILPYDQIVNLAISRRLTEKEIASIFGGSQLTFTAAPAASFPEATESDEPAVHEEQPETVAAKATEVAKPAPLPEKVPAPPAPPPADTDAPRPAAVSKTMLLARLRQRLADQGK